MDLALFSAPRLRHNDRTKSRLATVLPLASRFGRKGGGDFQQRGLEGGWLSGQGVEFTELFEESQARCIRMSKIDFRHSDACIYGIDFT